MKERVLLTGCHGRLGQHLLRLLLPQTEVLGLDLSPQTFIADPSFHYARVEGVGRRVMKDHFRDFRPDAVINAAAWTDVDGAEQHKEECWRANVELLRALTELCRPRNLWLGHVSTDYVFNGRSGPNEVEDLPDPLGVYGQSKLAAENLLRGCDFPAAILRTIVLYGKGHDLKPDFVEWGVQELRGGREIRVVTDQVGNCTWAMDLAQTMLQVLQQRRHGLYHVASRGCVSRWELARAAAEIHGLDPERVRPILTSELGQTAPRPLNGGLGLDLTERSLGIEFHHFRTSLWAYRADSPELWSIN